MYNSYVSDVLTDVESAADLLEENLRERIVPIRAQDIETVKKLESKSGMFVHDSFGFKAQM